MDQDVAREAEEDTGPQPQEELPGSGSQSESEEEEEDSSWESEPDPIIFQLVRQGNMAAVSQILRSDRTAVHQRDGMDHTPIHEPSSMAGGQSRALDMAKLLLSYGAPVNSQASESYTPLRIACVTGREKICNLLLTNGARYDLELGGWSKQTPLDCARTSLNGKIEILNILRR